MEEKEEKRRGGSAGMFDSQAKQTLEWRLPQLQSSTSIVGGFKPGQEEPLGEKEERWQHAHNQRFGFKSSGIQATGGSIGEMPITISCQPFEYLERIPGWKQWRGEMIPRLEVPSTEINIWAGGREGRGGRWQPEKLPWGGARGREESLERDQK